MEEARREAQALRKGAAIEAKESALRARADAERETKDRHSEISREAERLAQREETLEKRAEGAERKEREVLATERELVRREQATETTAVKAQELLAEARRKVERAAGMTAEQARMELALLVTEDARRDAAAEIRKVEEETRREADERAKRIIAQTIQRYASDFVHERTIAVVPLPSDDLKGRIIGREGRNIRALEAATGIDLIIDDTPEAVVVSCFDPVRREIAKIAIARQIADGRIHPARIEEIVAKCADEIEKQCLAAGEQAVFDLGLHRVNPELVKLLGKLRFKTSYAQNLLQHSVEVGAIAGMMAGELGLSVKLARRAGLLHDIGHAIGHEVEGSHAQVGALAAKKYGEAPRICQAILAHHGEVEPQDALDHLVDAANQLSAQRPGARREQMASYIQRMVDMEKVCTSFSGVERAYAILYGREVRVMVENSKVTDDQASALCRDIARKIEDDLSFPGQIKVHVIRETRAVDYAR